MEKLISIFEGDSIGSILSLQIAHKNDFLNFNESEILFRENRDWKDLEFTDETGEFSFNENENEHGELSTCSGVFGFHGPIQSIAKVMRPYLGRKSVLKITSLTKETFIIGHPENPVLIGSTGGTGKKYIDRPIVEYRFAVDVPIMCEGV